MVKFYIYDMRYRSFNNLPVSKRWCFKNVRSVERWTHGYHRYPAKFLPNLVKKLIEERTNKRDVVADLFAGCGTTLVESKIHGRKSIGVDINPVAGLITKVKTNPIAPEQLATRFEQFISCFDDYNEADFDDFIVHERLDYWFTPENKKKIAFLYKISWH
jgi:DNA modification methylase